MKYVKQAAVLFGWFLVFNFLSVSLFLSGMYFGKYTDFPAVGLVTVAGCALVFQFGKWYERYHKAIDPTKNNL